MRRENPFNETERAYQRGRLDGYEAGIAAERERCARLAERWRGMIYGVDAAAAIRDSTASSTGEEQGK